MYIVRKQENISSEYNDGCFEMRTRNGTKIYHFHTDRYTTLCAMIDIGSDELESCRHHIRYIALSMGAKIFPCANDMLKLPCRWVSASKT